MSKPIVRQVLHIVHGYNEPFLSLSNQYSRAMQQDGWFVRTVYLTGKMNEDIRNKTVADEVIFLDTPGREMKGLKLGLLLRIRSFISSNTQLIIAQRYKPVYLSLLASAGKPIPVLGVAHAFGVLASPTRRLLLAISRRRLTLAGVSDAVAQDMRSHADNLAVVTLHNCIDVDARAARLVDRAMARCQLGLRDDDFVFANVGRLHDDKDQSTIIRAFADVAQQYPDARLLLIGRGQKEAFYRHLIEELHLQDRVVMTGAIADVANLFRAFDVYVSASDREPFGIVLTEAMLAALPVISTDCGGAPEVLGEQALYFSRGDVAALAQHMRNLHAMPVVDRKRRGEQLCQRLQQNFAFESFCAQLLALVREITGVAR